MKPKYAIQEFRNGQWTYHNSLNGPRLYDNIERAKYTVNRWISDGYQNKLRVVRYASNN